MDIITLLTVIALVIAVIIGIRQIQLARKQIDVSKDQTNNTSRVQEITKEDDQPKVHADNNSVAVGKIEIGGDINGNITIGSTYYATVEEGKYRERPYPREIFEQINGLPLSQKEQAGNSYIGLKVKWRTVLKVISNKKSNLVELSMWDRDNYPWVYCIVSLSEYPEIKIAKDGHRMWVEGEISSIEDGGFHLVNCSLKID